MAKKDKDRKSRQGSSDGPADAAQVAHKPDANRTLAGFENVKVSETKSDTNSQPQVENRSLDQVAESDMDGAHPRSGMFVIGIGASAGGLQAFKSFLEAMPSETGMAFVLIPHLDPNHESMMVDLLSQRTTMPIREAREGTRVEADHVYVIPPNKYMEIRKGYLHLVTPEDPPARRTAIDRFFLSLAEDQQELAVGIVLSGTGSHGSPGLKEVKLAGGMVIIQDPKTAEYDQMPQTAIDAGLADFILPPQDMPLTLISYVSNPYVNRVDVEEEVEDLSSEMGRILAILRSRSRYDFRWYRKKMMMRRVQRRMGLRRIETPAAYLEFLRDNPEEVHSLYKDMLIGVTGFFREPEAFHIIQEQVIPELVKRSAGKTPVRVWVPGCATGEEPYSLAMLIVEEFENMSTPASLQIFATDIDKDSITRARDGIYPQSIAADVSPERLQRFFVQVDRRYQVKREIRDAVVFAPQNLISDAPFSRLHLISCRNLLIYLELPVQQRIISLFHFALREGGYLALGASESVGRYGDLFEPVSKKWRVFRRTGATRRDHYSTTVPIIPSKYNPVIVSEPQFGVHTALSEVMRRLLLDGYGPAAVLVNRSCEVLAFHGNTVEYLEFPSGEPSRDLITLLRSGLRSKVRAALQRSLREGVRIQTTAHVKRGAMYTPCRVEITPVREPREARGLFLVTFQDGSESGAQASGIEADPAAVQIEETSLLDQLENDLKSTREDLQITIEELESSNEELKAANEEMMSMNEELQSANEELETSKEELQSLNEELTTVNNQLNDKVEELDNAYTDLNNLLTSSEIATIFLDRSLRIRRFTSPSQKLLNVVKNDVGRPLADLSFRFFDPHLLDHAREVLEHLTVVEAQIRTEDGKTYLRRILPYRTKSDRIEGVTISFMDITDRRKQEGKLEAAFAGLEDQVSRRTAALAMIRDVAVQANAAGSVDEILEVALRRICDFHGWPVGFGYCARADGFHPETDTEAEAEAEAEELSLAISWTAEATRDSDRLRRAIGAKRLVPGEDLAGRAWSTGEPQWTDDLGRDLPLPVAEAATILQLRSGYAYPIQDNRNVVALFLLLGKDTEEPGPRTLELLSSIANQISLVIERERFRRQIREMSAYDQVRLSRDLHDAVGQQLAGLSMSAEVISRHLAQSGSTEAPALSEVVDGLRDTLQQIRLLARGLAEIPVGPGALAIALEQLCANNPAILHSTLQCRADVDRMVDIQNPDIATHLYRIAQEAVHNAVSHSLGKNIVISLKQDARHITLSIRDDGIGLGKATSSGMGLRTIRHRARLIKAALDVRSEQGTQITVRVPKGDAS